MRAMVRAVLAWGLAMLVIGQAAAQDFPSKPVRILVPFAASGPADIYARVLAEHLSQSLKQTFVVENRPGAGSLIGTGEAAKSAPDGHTLLMMSNTHTANESLFQNKPFQLMRDFAPVALINVSELVLVVHPSVPAKTLKELIDLAKAQPGTLNYASSGPGTPYHMAGELFKFMSGTDIVHVPYKGSAGARNDLVGGHVQMMIDSLTTMVPMARGGQVRALATTGLNRSDVLPDVPTASEAGVPGYESTIWLGVMTPTGTPMLVIEKLHGAINQVLTRDDIKKAWIEQGAPPSPVSIAAFDKVLREDIDKWAKVVKAANIKVN
jgi:tripartite-type tricarboxylate transporter receptor subunit TctC